MGVGDEKKLGEFSKIPKIFQRKRRKCGIISEIGGAKCQKLPLTHWKEP